jgi:hypothetical protein
MRPKRLVSLLPFFFCASAFSVSNGASSHAIPLVIERNQGQAPAGVRFLTRYGDLEALFTKDGVEFMGLGENSDARASWRLQGAAPVEPLGSNRLPSHSNYFLGSDSTQWVTGIENDGEVVYSGVYPGIDLAFHGSGGNLEHDFRVAPGADASKIAIRLGGPDRPSLNSNGDLQIGLGSGKLILHKPQSYQESATGRQSIDSEFTVAPSGEIRFRLGHYDRSRELVIDPVFGFSTYFSGSEASLPLAVATDKDGNIYVAGSAESAKFPLKNPLEKAPQFGGFVSSLDPSGKTLRFSTFLGSGDFAGISAISIDGAGNVVVTGIASSHVPHAGAPPAFSCSADSGCYFVASLDSSGSKLNYAGKAGGGVGNYGDNVLYPTLTLDSKRNAYLTGITDDPEFLITPGTLGNSASGVPYGSAFVMKFSPKGEVIYSTIIPGKPGNAEDDTFGITGIVVDADGLATIGGTASTGLPTTRGVVGYQFPNRNPAVSQTAGFVLRLNSTASAINYATYLPGTDQVGGIAQDKLGNIWIAGTTAETTLPVSAHAYQKTPTYFSPGSSACDGGFVVELGDSGRQILASTYLSGEYFEDSTDYCGGGLNGIALDSKANVYVGGFTGLSHFPMRNPLVDSFESQTGHAADMVLAGLNPSLSKLIFGTYLNPWGGGGTAFAALAIDSHNDLIVTGDSDADNFPTTPDVFQSKSPARLGGFISKIDLSAAAPSVCFNTTLLDFGPQPQVTLSVKLTNCGNAPLHIKSIVSSSKIFSVESSCSVVDPGASCPIDVTYTSTTPGRYSGTIIITDDAPVQPQVLFPFSTP